MSDEETLRQRMHFMKLDQGGEAALRSLKPLVDKDHEYTRRDAAYYYLGEALIKLQRQAEALPYYERLVN